MEFKNNFKHDFKNVFKNDTKNHMKNLHFVPFQKLDEIPENDSFKNT